MDVESWGYATDGTPYIVAIIQQCEARLGVLKCVCVAGHRGGHMAPGNCSNRYLWYGDLDGAESDG